MDIVFSVNYCRCFLLMDIVFFGELLSMFFIDGYSFIGKFNGEFNDEFNDDARKVTQYIGLHKVSSYTIYTTPSNDDLSYTSACAINIDLNP